MTKISQGYCRIVTSLPFSYMLKVGHPVESAKNLHLVLPEIHRNHVISICFPRPTHQNHQRIYKNLAIQGISDFRTMWGLFWGWGKSVKSVQVALCQCYEFWTCADRPDGGQFLVRVTLGSLDPPGQTDLVDASGTELTDPTPPLRGVRILELGGGKIFNKDVMLLGLAHMEDRGKDQVG